MRGFRAKDEDRDRFVEVIEAAYVDGQIGDADRELRVSRALSAETLDELQTLTRDLQVPAGGALPATGPVTSPVTLPSHPFRPARQRSAAGVIAALAAFAVLMAVGVTAVVALFAVSGDDRSASPDVVAVEPVESAGGTQVSGAAPFEMTAPEVRRFLRAYEKKFGTLDAWEVGFYPDRVGVQVPVSTTRKRFERWSWTGTWRQDTEASAVIGPQKFVSLGAVDVGRMFDNIERAKRTLDVPRGRLTHVLVNDWGQGPGVNIYIGNKFNETGYLRTAPGGAVIRAYPFAA